MRRSLWFKAGIVTVATVLGCFLGIRYELTQASSRASGPIAAKLVPQPTDVF